MFADATRKRLERSKGSQAGDGYGGVIIMWGIGYNQHIHGQHNVISIINLLALTGNLAKPGCGPFSMTGQPNAMGERFTGGLTDRLPFNQPLSNDKHRAQMAEHWGVPEENLVTAMNAPNPGFAVGMHERALKGDVKAMFYVYATHIDLPDQFNLIRPALMKTFNVVQEIYRHAPNNLYADVIFPAATWGEVEGVYISSERRININQKAAEPPPGCLPDMDMVIDKGKEIAHLLGMDADKVFPYQRKEDGYYDAQEIFRDVCRASAGTDTDLTGLLEVEKIDGVTPYEQLAKLRGIQWPAPTYAIAKEGGVKRRFMAQEGEAWSNRPYGFFRTKDGKVHMKLCKQDYSDREKVTRRLMEFGEKEGLLTIDHIDLLVEARDKGLTPDMPDEKFRNRKWEDVPKDKYPYWMGLGVVYEHFHTAKSNRSPTTRRLVPEMYVEMHPDDAKDLGIEDGEWVRVVTRRGSLEAKAQVGTNSLVKPARNNVPRGYMFGPWNLSVADSADPKKNKWLANGITSRIWDPVSGQVDFKKLACRIEKV
jgi:nitrate reductase NapA